MKFLSRFVVVFLVAVCSVSAQNINQFDTHGKRHGVWKKNFENTKVLRYEGAFNHGKEVGLFKFYKKIDNKPVLSASKQFNETNNIAYVQFFTSRGKIISEGQMHGKIYIGEWKYYQKNADNLLILEHYDTSGNLTGDRFIYYKNGQISEQSHYEKGKLDGESVSYAENGVVLKRLIYSLGELHGISKYFNPKGEIITQGRYKNGKKDGVWSYFKDGKLIDKKDFSYKSKYKKKAP